MTRNFYFKEKIILIILISFFILISISFHEFLEFCGVIRDAL